MQEYNRIEVINREKVDIPDDYHCNCNFCKDFKGLLIRKDGTKYNKYDRRKYYHKDEMGRNGHIAKTPLHLARWAIQNFTKENDIVLDPTVGSGTTVVEALNHGRRGVGIELSYFDILKKNISINNPYNKECLIYHGDVRDVKRLIPLDKKAKLIINNPPYSGDESQASFDSNDRLKYKKDDRNIAFLKENKNYWDQMESIYKTLIDDYLLKDGYFVIGVKDMMKNKIPFLLHKMFGVILSKYLKYIGMVLLPHYPSTLFMNTYPKRMKIDLIPRYQTILIFKKG